MELSLQGRKSEEVSEKGGQKLEGDWTNLPLCDWQLCTALFKGAHTTAGERKTTLPAKKSHQSGFHVFQCLNCFVKLLLLQYPRLSV